MIVTAAARYALPSNLRWKEYDISAFTTYVAQEGNVFYVATTTIDNDAVVFKVTLDDILNSLAENEFECSRSELKSYLENYEGDEYDDDLENAAWYCTYYAPDSYIVKTIGSYASMEEANEAVDEFVGR